LLQVQYPLELDAEQTSFIFELLVQSRPTNLDAFAVDAFAVDALAVDAFAVDAFAVDALAVVEKFAADA
jgi:hypothetical protein